MSKVVFLLLKINRKNEITHCVIDEKVLLYTQRVKKKGDEAYENIIIFWGEM